jgi:hypothetical protein
MRRPGVRIPAAPPWDTLSDLRKRRRMDRVSCYVTIRLVPPARPKPAHALHAPDLRFSVRRRVGVVAEGTAIDPVRAGQVHRDEAGDRTSSVAAA